MPFYVYILQSAHDRTYYVGHTEDLEERLKRHNQGRSQYTKSRCPWRIVYHEEHTTRSAAMQRERTLKSLRRRDLLEQLFLTVQ